LGIINRPIFEGEKGMLLSWEEREMKEIENKKIRENYFLSSKFEDNKF
jgi:hypothetical protein